MESLAEAFMDKVTENTDEKNYRVLRDFGFLPKPDTFYLGQNVIMLGGQPDKNETLCLRSGLVYSFNATHVTILTVTGDMWTASNYRIALY